MTEAPPPVAALTVAQQLAAAKTLPPVRGKRGTVHTTTWAAWHDARAVVTYWQDQADAYEVALREELGDAAVIVAGGQVVGYRIADGDSDRITGGGAEDASGV
jgi:hypothetical protein